MLRRWLFSLAALLAASAPALAQDSGTAETLNGVLVRCGQGVDARYYPLPAGESAATICPAQLSGLSAGSVGDDSATLTVTSNLGSGTLHCLTTQSATPPALSLILAEPAIPVAAAGTLVVSVTGLETGTSYFTYCAQQGNRKVSLIAASDAYATVVGFVEAAIARRDTGYVEVYTPSPNPHGFLRDQSQITSTGAYSYRIKPGTLNAGLQINLLPGGLASITANASIASGTYDVVIELRNEGTQQVTELASAAFREVIIQ